MDTGTHVVMGIALFGFATLSSTISGHAPTHDAVLAATLIGSQIPDIDTVLKLRGNATYIRHHRGITHSLPALFLWPLILTVVLHYAFPLAHIFPIFLSALIAVVLHVFVDIFNAYGTQALRPLSHEWIALGVINTFDPIIFSGHVIAIAFWLYGASPLVTFVPLYFILLSYYIYRFWRKRQLVQQLRHLLPTLQHYYISPTWRQSHWRIAAVTTDEYIVARAMGGTIRLLDHFPREEWPPHPLLDYALTDANVASFLSFSKVHRFELIEHADHTELRWTDLRYRHNDYYPFIAVVHVNSDGHILTSFTGWIFSEERLAKKLNLSP